MTSQARARRGGAQDYYARYAAAGRRNGTARIQMTLALDVDRKGTCPAALLLGVDAAPEPGLRGPTNFHGSLSGVLLAELDALLRGVRRQLWCAAPVSEFLGFVGSGFRAELDTLLRGVRHQLWCARGRGGGARVLDVEVSVTGGLSQGW